LGGVGGDLLKCFTDNEFDGITGIGWDASGKGERDSADICNVLNVFAGGYFAAGSRIIGEATQAVNAVQPEMLAKRAAIIEPTLAARPHASAGDQAL
jgi:hypothetical protein